MHEDPDVQFPCTTPASLLPSPPRSITFLQCFSTVDILEKGESKFNFSSKSYSFQLYNFDSLKPRNYDSLLSKSRNFVT